MNKNQHIYWAKVEHGEWSLYIAATEKGLAFVGSNHKPFNELAQWAARRKPGYALVQNAERLAPYAKEIIEYLQGERQQFSVAHDLSGTPFQQAVWRALQQIPYGQTASYSDIAAHINNSAAVRAVGAAIGANPLLLTIPCHRVVGKDGKLTGYRGGLPMKTELLKLEKTSEKRSAAHV